MMMNDFRFYAAPMQGYTDTAWRDAHRQLFGNGISAYYTPFVRVEKGEPRRRDLRDTAVVDDRVVPQIIFGSVDEFDLLIEALRRQGHRQIDINMGCPFVPQVRKGRGAGLIMSPDVLAGVSEHMASMPDVRFSLKMRLGVDRAGQWRGVVSVLRSMPLTHITLHPRVARQQYAGEVDVDEFCRVADELGRQLIFNGDVTSFDDIERVMALPHASGVMIGRGLLSRPTLVSEWLAGSEADEAERLEAVLAMHRRVYDQRVPRLCGESQVLSVMKPFWDYLEPLIGHRALKAIAKARTVVAYHAAVPQSKNGRPA